MTPVDRRRGEHAEALRAALADAVQTHLVADVPLGLFLSGGLDSSAIAMLMQQAGMRPLIAFTLFYDDGSYSELDYAAMNIVRLASPFDPFPSGMRDSYPVLRFAYEWQFLRGRLGSGAVLTEEP